MSFKDYFLKEDKDRFGDGRKTIRTGRLVGAITGAVFALTTATCSVTTVPAGYEGVPTRFGQVQQTAYKPGLHLKIPWEAVHNMSTRTRQVKENLKVPTSEGLIAGLDVSVLYHADAARLPFVYDKLGDDDMYQTTVVEPLNRSSVRDIVAGYRADDLYSKARTQIASNIKTKLAPEFTARGLVLEDVLIRDLELPPSLTKAIGDKMAMEQESMKMDYVVAKQKKEAERLVVEAKGIAESQDIISKKLTPEYLQWKYIEALEKNVNSPNNTTVILPFDTKLTPMLNMPTGKPHTPQ